MRRFGRGRDPDEQAAVGPRGEGAAASPHGQVDEVVRELTGLVMDGMRECPLAEDTLRLLQVGLPYMTQRDCSTEAIIAGQTAARLGYLSRAAEFATFPAAQELDPALHDVLSSRLEAAGADAGSTADTLAELAADMVLTEPLDPSSHEGGPSSTLPGIGADLRGALRDHLVRALRRPADVDLDELQQTWKYGFFLRGLEELFEDDTAGP